MSNSNTGPRDITTDHETIRDWVEKRGGTPAHITGQIDDDASSLYIVREDESMDDLEPMSWDEFFETFEAENLVFVYQDRDVGETDEWLYNLIDRQEVAERASLERSEVENALLEGDVVRSEITETKVIEKTVVETDQIESQIVDSEIIESNLVDRETISRELVGVEFTDAPSQLTATVKSEHSQETLGADIDEVDRTDQETVDTGTKSAMDVGTDTEAGSDTATGPDTTKLEPESSAKAVSESVDETTTDRHVADESTTGLGVDNKVVLDVHDTVQTTTEVFDRQTVESRVVGQEVTQSDTLESDAIDIQGIEESILESDLIEGEIVSNETTEGEMETETETTTRTQTGSLPSGAITSEQAEEDAVHSQFVERRLIETESTERHQVTCNISDHKLLDTIDSRSSVLERAIVDREAGEEAMLRQPETGARTTDEQITAEETATPTGEADAEMAPPTEGEMGESGAVDEPSEPTPMISEDDIGKQVVAGDKEVGTVSDVDDRMLYVDPESSLTDRIKSALDWGDTDDDSYSVERDQIESVDDEEVRIREI